MYDLGIETPLWSLVGFLILFPWDECCFKLFQIWVKLESCQSWWEKLKVNQDCLFSRKTNTGEFNFAFSVSLVA